MASSATQEYFRKLNTIALNLKMIDTELKRAKKGMFSLTRVELETEKMLENFREARELLGED